MPVPTKRKPVRLKKSRPKTLRLKQVRTSVGRPRETREALKALGLGKLYQFIEIPDTREVRGLIARVPHMVSILDGPDILFPREKSTFDEERLRDVMEAIRAEQNRG